MTDIFEGLITLKQKADHLNGQVNKVFRFLAKGCTSRKRKLHDGKDEWFKCTHRDYHLRKYTEVTPCDKKYCPRLRK